MGNKPTTTREDESFFKMPSLGRKLAPPQSASGGEVKKRRVWSTIDTHHQEKMIEMLMANGVRSPSQFQEALEKQIGQKLTFTRIKMLVERIQHRWMTEDAETATRNRSAATRRAYRNLNKAHQKEDMGSVIRIENMINQIEGNYAPIRYELRVEVTQAMMATIGNMSLKQMNELMEKYQRTQALAQVAIKAGLVVDGESTVKK